MRYITYALLIVCFGFAYIFANPLVLYHKDAQVIKTSAIITHISAKDNEIFIGNADGSVAIYRLDSTNKARLFASFRLPYIKDYFDILTPPRIFDIAIFNQKAIMVLSQGHKGIRQVLRIYRKDIQNHNFLALKNAPEVIYTTNAALSVIKPYHNALVMGFLSNEIATYDIQKGVFMWNTHPSFAGFSSLTLNNDLIFSTDESGIVTSIDARSGQILARLDAINKDNNYQIASSGDIILTGSTDRQVGVYRFTLNPTFTITQKRAIKSPFLVYAVGISQDGRLGAYSKNEDNDIAIVDLANLKEIYTLKGSQSLINALIFLKPHIIISGSDDKSFTVWNLPKSH